MTHARQTDLVFALTLAIWLSVLAAVFLAVCAQRGFNDTLCKAYQACDWRDA